MRIEGHTDSIRSDAYNMRLSRHRAETVKAYLVSEFAVEPERLEVFVVREIRQGRSTVGV